MKKQSIGLLLALVFVLMAASPVWAHDYDPDDTDNPLRYAAYVVNPVGELVSFVVTRPIHWVVSRPYLCVVFGHQPRPGDRYFKVDKYNRSLWELERLQLAAESAKAGKGCHATKAERRCRADKHPTGADGCPVKSVKTADAGK